MEGRALRQINRAPLAHDGGCRRSARWLERQNNREARLETLHRRSNEAFGHRQQSRFAPWRSVCWTSGDKRRRGRDPSVL